MKKKYIRPQIEVIAVEVGHSILRASNMGFYDPTTGASETAPIPDNDDEDFSAGAKPHFLNLWEDDDDVQQVGLSYYNW